jgi:phospholipid-binding lipoprotein MlaA
MGWAARRLLLAAAPLAMAAMAGQAAAQPNPPAPVSPRALQQSDPLERFNRAMFSVDRRINRLIGGRGSIGATKVVPDTVKTGVYNAFNNLSEPVTVANDLLQLKLRRAGVAAARFGINSTVGLLGTRDVASRAGLARHREDFGQTLARWGAPAGPYIYLPLMGPSTVSDKLAGQVDGYAHPLGWAEMDELPGRAIDYTEKAVQPKTVGIRARARAAVESGETEDEYAYLRDLYYAQRAAEIQDTKDEDAYTVPAPTWEGAQPPLAPTQVASAQDQALDASALRAEDQAYADSWRIAGQR